MKHTKGEWIVKHSESKTAFNVTGSVLGGRYKIARCPYNQIEDSPIYNSKEKSEAQANAKLIAAAPDLLGALKSCIYLFDELDVKGHAVNQAQAAIKKATE